MTCIGWDRELDPALHDFYFRNLLEPEWAGELDRVELAYIRSQLQQSPSLRRRWGFRPSARRLSEARIRAVAMHGISRSVGAVSASVRRGGRSDLMENTRVTPKAGPSATKSASAKALGRK
jgi:hypothetical protein